MGRFVTNGPYEMCNTNYTMDPIYTVKGWGVMSCVSCMIFHCGSTLVKVPMLQADTVVIYIQMFKATFNLNKSTIKQDQD